MPLRNELRNHFIAWLFPWKGRLLRPLADPYFVIAIVLDAHCDCFQSFPPDHKRLVRLASLIQFEDQSVRFI